MSNVVNLSGKTAELKRSDAMLQEYVRIRHSITGTERIVALVAWASKVDTMMTERGLGPEKYAEVSHG